MTGINRLNLFSYPSNPSCRHRPESVKTESPKVSLPWISETAPMAGISFDPAR